MLNERLTKFLPTVERESSPPPYPELLHDDLHDDLTLTESSSSTAGSSTHNITDYKKRAIAKNTRDFFIGTWKLQTFLDEFLPKPPTPCPETRKTDFQTVLDGKEKNLMYEPFLRDARRFAPDLDLVDCHAHDDPAVRIAGAGSKPDICAYPKTDRGTGITNFFKMAFHGEFKYNRADDAFLDGGRSLFCREEGSQDTLGQLVAYANAQLAVQFRTHIFSLGVFYDCARIIRWDRSGAIVTKAFNYVKSPELLAEFLWRFNYASPEDRGEDTSTSTPSDQDAADARVALGLDSTKPLVQFMVPPESLPDDTHEAVPAFYIGEPPRYKSRSPVGRATRPFRVYDIAKKRLMFLKDTWRIFSPGEMEKEGEIYLSLHKHKVPYIAKFERAGDIPGRYQQTITQDFAPRRSSRRKFVTYRHYRLVLGTFGRALDTFSSTRELVTAVADALEAHKCAWEIEDDDHSRLHRDISVGNILIDKNGRGLLIDWEYSMTKSRLGPGKSRAGTWPFISAALLQDPKRSHELKDDLESFLHVLTWVAVCYSPTDFPPAYLGDFLSRIYGECTVAAGMPFGGLAKGYALGSGHYCEMEFTDRPAFTTLLVTLAMCFATRYSLYLKLQEQQLASSTWMLGTLRAVAEAGLLPDNDRAVLQEVENPPELLIRKRSITEVISESGDSRPSKKPRLMLDWQVN